MLFLMGTLKEVEIFWLLEKLWNFEIFGPKNWNFFFTFLHSIFSAFLGLKHMRKTMFFM